MRSHSLIPCTRASHFSSARLGCLVLTLLGFLALESEAEAKTKFHLFDPTPPGLMREMNTDRPDTTESPYTVDAGHFQLEMSFFDYQCSRDSGLRGDAWSFGQINFKAGLCHNTDVQLVFNAYDTARVTGFGGTTSMSGFADVTVRLKTNIWGNEDGKTALALMPYFVAPTGGPVGSDEWGGGLIVPLSVGLTDSVSLNLMLQADLVPDVVAGGYDVAWIHTASLGIALTERLGSYVELVGVAGSGGLNYQALFNTGLTLSVSDNLIFDAGIRVGLNDDTPDLGVFTGVSIRY